MDAFEANDLDFYSSLKNSKKVRRLKIFDISKYDLTRTVETQSGFFGEFAAK